MRKKQKKQSKALVVRQNTTPEMLIMEGVKKGISVDTMERLLVIRREVKAEQGKEAFNLALSSFQSECPIIKKLKVVKNKDGSRRYAYAPLDSIVEQVRPFLMKNRLSFTIDSVVEDKWVKATCKITHELGHSETSTFQVPIAADAYMTEPQKFASALTFAKRYAFVNALGILTGDEDIDAVDAGTPGKIYVAKKSKVEPVSPEDKFQSALAIIKACKNKETLSRYYKDIQEKGPKIYDEQQMSQLVETLVVKATELDPKK